MKLLLAVFLGLVPVGVAGCAGTEAPVAPIVHVPKQAIDDSKEIALNSNISQIQTLVGMYRGDNEGRVPASLDELRKYGKDYPAEMWVNPIDGKPLIYDAATGVVKAQPYAIGGPDRPVSQGSNPQAADKSMQ